MTRKQAVKKARKAAKALRNGLVIRMERLNLWTYRHAAEKVGISVPRIYQLVKEGKLEGTREGALRFVRRSSLKRRFPHAFPSRRRTKAKTKTKTKTKAT